MIQIKVLRELVSNTEGKFLSSRMTSKYLNKINPDIVLFVLSSTSFYSEEEINFTKRIMLVLGNKKSRLTCSCGIEISPMKHGESAGLFKQFCSQFCSGSSNKGKKIIRDSNQQKTINDKRSETMIKKYGHKFNSQRSEVKKTLSASKFKTHNHIRYDILEDKEKLLSMYKTYASTQIGELCCCDYSVVLEYLRKYGVTNIGENHNKISQEQMRLGDFITSLGFEIRMNSRILDGKDIDIFVSDKSVGIEYNGFPHHLEDFSNRNRGMSYHFNKTIDAINIGVRLIHVFPQDYKYKKDIIHSIIKNSLGVSGDKIYARNCRVEIVEKQEATEFLNKNHLKNSSNFKVGVGLYYKDHLVHVMTFGNSRFDKKYTYEIVRSASEINLNIVGGLSKCLSYFVKNFCKKGNSIMTYADRAISEGKSYEKIGFNFVRSTEPGYHYTCRNGSDFIVYSRYKFQKHKLKELINYSDSKSEWDIMRESGYDRFWDCGNNVYEYIV